MALTQTNKLTEKEAKFLLEVLKKVARVEMQVQGDPKDLEKLDVIIEKIENLYAE